MIHSPWEGLMMKECLHSTKTLMRHKGRAWCKYKEFLSKIRNIGVLEKLFFKLLPEPFLLLVPHFAASQRKSPEKDKEKNYECTVGCLQMKERQNFYLCVDEASQNADVQTKKVDWVVFVVAGNKHQHHRR